MVQSPLRDITIDSIVVVFLYLHTILDILTSNVFIPLTPDFPSFHTIRL